MKCMASVLIRKKCETLLRILVELLNLPKRIGRLSSATTIYFPNGFAAVSANMIQSIYLS